MIFESKIEKEDCHERDGDNRRTASGRQINGDRQFGRVLSDRVSIFQQQKTASLVSVARESANRGTREYAAWRDFYAAGA